MKKKKKYKVLFCDLDGTLIETISGATFPKGVWDMKLKFDVLDSIKALAPEYVFIVTNQGGIEKGFVDENNFRDKLDYVTDSIAEYCNIDRLNKGWGYCSSNDKNNKNRKPNTGLLEALWKDGLKHVSEKSDCLMIGDASGLEGQFSDSDKKTAENFGIDYMDVSEFVEQYKI